MSEVDRNIEYFNLQAMETAERFACVLDVRSSLIDSFLMKPLFEVAYVALGRLNDNNNEERRFAADVFLWRSSVFFLEKGFNEFFADMVSEVFDFYPPLKESYFRLNQYLKNPLSEDNVTYLRVSTADEPPTVESIFMT